MEIREEDMVARSPPSTTVAGLIPLQRSGYSSMFLMRLVVVGYQQPDQCASLLGSVILSSLTPSQPQALFWQEKCFTGRQPLKLFFS